VQLDQPPDQTQADTQAAAAARERVLEAAVSRRYRKLVFGPACLSRASSA
jgi:hypothetical protein